MKWSTNLIPFSPCIDRFCTGGYRPPISLKERIELAAQIDGLNGVELHYPSLFRETDVPRVKDYLKDNGLDCSVVSPALSGEAKWQNGSLTNPDERIRADAIGLIKEAMDIAKELGANRINLWMGQDGYDYPLQVDHGRIWELLVEGVNECARHNPQVKICLESKLKEPRTHSALGSIAKVLLLANTVGLPNVGANLDTGHAFMAYENPAEWAVILHKHNRLFHLHLNDNYGDWDWDMVVGTVHFAEFLELLFWLRQIGYDGWYSLDQFPTREDPRKALELSIRNVKAMDQVAQGLNAKEVLAAVRRHDAISTIDQIRQSLFATYK
ncbi:MAG: sugar phosphate isomerase/epimerase [Chloroflexi bacterium]|nr:sugar phosphate isomerase/epimerase [Chloroflexota bacterium]MCL5076364.1 sugar phosphate isomerase/epimerase [Chloroflexota bacterium]